MRYRLLVLLDKVLQALHKCNVYFLLTTFTVIVWPFYAIYAVCMYVNRKLRGMVYDKSVKEWVTRDKYEKTILDEKRQNREIPLIQEGHTTPYKDDRFYFFKKRKLTIPYDQLVYVETEYNEKLHSFFADNAEWLATWQRWHGLDIVMCDNEDIKEGMFYPQDFAVFRHGFLWHSINSSWEKDSHLFGNIHYYYDIDPDSAIPIKEQMEQFVRKIYAVSFFYVIFYL